MKSSIGKDSVVHIHYTLTLDDGSIVDSSSGNEPLVYLHGHGNLVPGLERQLTGKRGGDKFAAVVEAADGYGEFDPDGEQRVPRDAFPADAQLEDGMQIYTEDPQGNVMPLWIKSILDDGITITSNHPLAGQRLNFQIEVVELREATPEELEHGHVHGPGGEH